MIKTLNSDQRMIIDKYKTKYLKYATAVNCTDKLQAEKSISKISQLNGVAIKGFNWVNTLREGYLQRMFYFSFASVSYVLKDFLFNYVFNTYLSEDVKRYLDTHFLNLNYPPSICKYTKEILFDSFLDYKFIALYMYLIEVLDVPCENRSKEIILLYSKLIQSCFSVWVCPHTPVIICEKPKEIIIEDNILCSITWNSVNCMEESSQ
jgi:hypothetical protein